MNIEKSKFNEYLGAPPLTGTSVKNGMVWTLAFAPAIGQLCEGFVGSIIGMQYFEKLWFITVLLNIGLSLADERVLKKAGHDTSKMGSAWIVPVYLYKRAHVLKQNLAYFITWIVVFALVLLKIL